MKRLLLNIAIILTAVSGALAQPFNPGQIHLYLSKQTGEFCTYKGENGKTTDKYEEGSVTITTTGPIKYTVDPNELEIAPNQTKNWKGSVFPDMAAAPQAGTSKSAQIKGKYTVTFSRPAGGGQGGVVQSTYQCNNGIDDGCSTHGPAGGDHEIVKKDGEEILDFEVYSIKVDITSDLICSNGKVQLQCQTFPASGNITWNTPFGQFNGTDVTADVPPGFPGGLVTCTYSVPCGDGNTVTYTDSRMMAANTGTLNGFVANNCFGEPTTAPAVTLVSFAGPGNGGGCPANNLIYAPFNISPPIVTQTSTIPLSVTSGAVTLNSSIIGVNKNKAITQTITIDFGAAASIMESIENAFSSAITGAASPCSPSGSLIPAGSISRSTFKECCGGAFVKDQTKYAGSVSWAPGIGCRFPFAGIPYIASLDVILNAGVSVSLGVDGTTQCAGPPQICANASASASLGAGIGGTVLSGFIQADLTIVVDGISCQVQYCFMPAPAAGTISGNLGAVKVVGTLSGGWGLASYSVDYTLLDGYPLGPINF